MDRTFAPNYTVVAGKRVYQDRDEPNGIPGTSLLAEDRTKVEEELIGGIIEQAGLTPDRADLRQINKALLIMCSAYERGVAPWGLSVAQRIDGYPLNAIVCDPASPGVFWVSSQDGNLTEPGKDGAQWKSLFNGYATEAWSNGKFVAQAVDTDDYGALQAGVQKNTGRMWFAYDDGAGVKYAFSQPSGDYATNTALSAEASSRASADTNLQNQVNNRVVKTGDTMTGSLSINTSGDGVIASGNGGGDNVPGGAAFSAGFKSSPGVGGVLAAIYRYIHVNGEGSFATIWLTDGDGHNHELRFGADDRLRTASGHVFALTSELPTSGTLPGGYWLKVGNILFQSFVVPVAHDGLFVAFPIAYAGGSKPVVTGVAGATPDEWVGWLSTAVYPTAENYVTNTGITLTMPAQKASSGGIITSGDPVSCRLNVMGIV